MIVLCFCMFTGMRIVNSKAVFRLVLKRYGYFEGQVTKDDDLMGEIIIIISLLENEDTV